MRSFKIKLVFNRLSIKVCPTAQSNFFQKQALGLSRMKFLIPLLLVFFAIEISSGCYPTTQQFTYSYQWKKRNQPIYNGDQLSGMVDICPSGCDANCSIPDCDDAAIQGLRIAQEEFKGFIHFSANIVTPLIIRSTLFGIIILLNIYLFLRGHFRIKDLFVEKATNQWKTEEKPTSGLTPNIWANLKVTVEKTKDKNAKPEKKKDENVNPIVRGAVFWRFRKIFNLFYGRERYYRAARFFNPLKWQLHHFGKVVLEDLKNKKLEELSKLEIVNKDYEWKNDIIRGDITQALLDKLGEIEYEAQEVEENI